ncbi:pre-toxin TG domain-containing protein [Kitasatospora sp. NPDC049285]|uniref:pre-toxin TG domain-containing protein n=1 Tax=Kitasatospora sp. NPDC049285 TaxID=3157096 RepID=UPI00343BE99D
MTEVEVRVPIRLRLVGTPTAADLERLEAAVARLVARRLAQAERALAQHGPTGHRTGAVQAPSERYESALDLPSGGYRLTSYQGPPRQVRLPVARPATGPQAQQAALQRIGELLSRNLTDWAITDAEAREALRVLRRLAPEDVVAVVQALRYSGKLAVLGEQLPSDADDDLIDLQQKLDPNSGWLMPGDTVRVEVRLGGRRQDDVSRDYPLTAAGLTLPMLERPLPVTGLLPAELPDRIVRAYLDGLIYRDPAVRVAVVVRGPRWAPRQGPTRGLLWYDSHPVRRSAADQAQFDKRRELFGYLTGVRLDDELAQGAFVRYHAWIEKHYGTPEFLRQTGPDLWSAALKETATPAAPSVRTRFLELAAVMQRTSRSLPATEQAAVTAALGDYLSWLDRQSDADLGRHDPGATWARLYVRQLGTKVREEVADKLRKARETALDKAATWDPDGAGRKLDQVIAFLEKRVWKVREPYTVEDRKNRVGWLVWESEREKAVRDLIAREFLHEEIARMHEKSFTATSAEADFRDFLRAHPEEFDAYLIAQAYPEAERYDIPPEDIPLWQTAIETAVSFIPVVGSIVAAGEAAFGYDLFGHELSTTDRAILGASVLLPAAGKVFKMGRAAVTVETMVRDYRLSAREADATFRALSGLKPGSNGLRALDEAAREVKAGRSVRDAGKLNELKELFTTMGLTDQATARELRAGAAESVLSGEAGRAGQKAADKYFLAEEVDQLVAAVEEQRATRPSATGGARPTVDEVRVPVNKRTRLDIENLVRRTGETRRQALERARRVLGQRLDRTPLGPVWERARAKVVGTRSLENATRQEMFDLYGKVRDEFWIQAKADTGATTYLRDAGFSFPDKGRAPLIDVADAPPGLGLPRAADIGVQERRVSLDHNLEKALGENYRKAIDADNLTFEMHNPNSNRETVQVKFGLRATPGVTE